MDKRIGYGLSFEEAVSMAAEAAQKLEGGLDHLSISTKNYETVWAELRDDGWRVYRPKKKGELTHESLCLSCSVRETKKRTAS